MLIRSLILVLLAISQTALAATIEVIDDTGQKVALEHTARRIVSLAPHVTELLFTAGAGDRVIAAVSHSDYPPQAARLPRVGSHGNLDIERIIALRPDLVVAWASGNNHEQLQSLHDFGISIFYSEPRRIAHISSNLRSLGRLSGHAETAQRQADMFDKQMATLREKYARREPVSVFYQIWHQPLMTVNNEHLITQAIRLCGGYNVFGELHALAPTLDVEAVLQADPDIIIASGMNEERPEWLDMWHQWPQLTAVRSLQMYVIPPDLLQRHSTRFMQGTRRLCELMDRVRSDSKREVQSGISLSVP